MHLGTFQRNGNFLLLLEWKICDARAHPVWVEIEHLILPLFGIPVAQTGLATDTSLIYTYKYSFFEYCLVK